MAFICPTEGLSQTVNPHHGDRPHLGDGSGDDILALNLDLLSGPRIESHPKIGLAHFGQLVGKVAASYS